MSHAVTVRRYTKIKWQSSVGGTGDQSDQRDIPHHRLSCPVYKLGDLLGNGADLGL